MTGPCYRALRRLPGRDFHPLERRSFHGAPYSEYNRVVDRKVDLVHCGAGVGRTGTFADAVLMSLGYTYNDAYEEINAAGSHPEMPAQREFLQRGRLLH
ncbi:MAG: hypothetical protein WD492_06030 [Alkalispirochaeta sp.]